MNDTSNRLNFGNSLVPWFIHINYGLLKPLRWQKPLFELLTYSLMGKCSKIMVSSPPQHGKTMLICESFISYYMINHPDDKVIVTAYSQDRATKYGLRLRNIINTFSNKTLFQPSLSQDQQTKTNFMLASPYNGELLASGSHGSIMGNPANLIVIDDPIKELKDANSKTMQDNLEEWYIGSVNTRLRKNDMKRPPIVIVVAQRLNLKDLQGILKKNNHYIDGKEALTKLRQNKTIDKDTWIDINFPAICDNPTTDVLNRQKGEVLWSAHKSLKDLQNDKRMMGEYRFNTIYQGRPTKLAGSLFKRHWFYDEKGKLNCLSPKEIVYPFLRQIRTWDLSARFRQIDLDGADEVAGILTGYDPKQDIMYVYNMVNGKYTATELLNIIKRTIHQDTKEVITNIEQEGGSHSVLFITQLEQEMRDYSIQHHKPVGDKAYRSLELQAMASTGRLKFVVTSNSNNSWITKIVEQLIEFDGKESNAREKKHDDIVDSLSASANYWLVDRKQPTL